MSGNLDQTITVRVAGADDVSGVDALLQRSYPRLLKADYPPSVMVTAVPLISRAKVALVCCGTYYVAEDIDGRIIGAGGWTPKRHAPGVADIRHVATDPDTVRRGVGRALLGRILSDAEAAGVVRFDCLSTRTAVPFYRSLGFTVMSEVSLQLAKAIAFPAVQMQRVI